MSIRAILQTKSGEILSIAGDAVVTDAIALLAERRIGALPVIENDHVCGIFSERDVVYGIAREGAAFLSRKVAEVMITPPITASIDETAIGALSLMTRRRIRHLPVMDGGQHVGFISIGDLVKYRIDRIEAEAAALRDYIAS